MLQQILADRSFRLAILLTFLFLGTGFAFLHYGLVQYGWVFFVLLPVVLGVSIGALPDRRWASYGLTISVVIFLMMLLVGKLEGFICVLMTLPILVPLIFLGSVLSHLARRYQLLKAGQRNYMLVLPLGLFLVGAPVEKRLTPEPRQVIRVSSELLLPNTPMQVYDAIKSVDTLVAEKTWLMKIDLPVPHKCVLEREAVGGLRICYFDGGRIVERITALEKGQLLQMDVVKYELTGRKWLGFKEAIYYFEPVGTDSCRMSRVTTYTSELKPRFYWGPLERMGIEQEHQYVFENLRRDLRHKTAAARPQP